MEFTGECNYVNCLDKDPVEIKPKDQNFDEAAEKIVSITFDNSKTCLIQNINQLCGQLS
jgi:hypothetical protein